MEADLVFSPRRGGYKALSLTEEVSEEVENAVEELYKLLCIITDITFNVNERQNGAPHFLRCAALCIWLYHRV